jgi:hypothetical protein
MKRLKCTEQVQNRLIWKDIVEKAKTIRVVAQKKKKKKKKTEEGKEKIKTVILTIFHVFGMIISLYYFFGNF